MPKVSVIIPSYNQGKFITATIDSILNQTFKDFEIIVVVDGSTDDTKLQLEKYKNKIKIIELERSERAVARNTGVKNSSGEYIAFVDSDDIWKPKKLETQIPALDENKKTVLVYCASERINEHGNKIKTAKRQTQGYSGNVYEKLLLRNFVVSATPVLKRCALEQTDGFITKYIPYEDWELWIRLSTTGNFKFIDTPLASYRIHLMQTVKLVTAEKIEEVTNLLLNDSFKLSHIDNKLRNKSLSLANLRYCYWYLLAKKYEIAKEKIHTALKLNPELLFDPRWYGLRFLCTFPVFIGRGLFDLRQYH